MYKAHTHRAALADREAEAQEPPVPSVLPLPLGCPLNQEPFDFSHSLPPTPIYQVIQANGCFSSFERLPGKDLLHIPH